MQYLCFNFMIFNNTIISINIFYGFFIPFSIIIKKNNNNTKINI